MTYYREFNWQYVVEDIDVTFGGIDIIIPGRITLTIHEMVNGSWEIYDATAEGVMLRPTDVPFHAAIQAAIITSLRTDSHFRRERTDALDENRNLRVSA